jgi:DNA-dependent RNA polymerase auxiliary subunit epsilon
MLPKPEMNSLYLYTIYHADLAPDLQEFFDNLNTPYCEERERRLRHIREAYNNYHVEFIRHEGKYYQYEKEEKAFGSSLEEAFPLLQLEEEYLFVYRTLIVTGVPYDKLPLEVSLLTREQMA